MRDFRVNRSKNRPKTDFDYIQLADAIRSAFGGKHSKIDPATELQAIESPSMMNYERSKSHSKPDRTPRTTRTLSNHQLPFIGRRIVKQTFKRESVDCICPPEQLIAPAVRQA